MSKVSIKIVEKPEIISGRVFLEWGPEPEDGCTWDPQNGETTEQLLARHGWAVESLSATAHRFDVGSALGFVGRTGYAVKVH